MRPEPLARRVRPVRRVIPVRRARPGWRRRNWPDGPQGATGDQGATGATGATGNFGGVVVRTTVSAAGEQGLVTVTCQPGETAVGGGASSTGNAQIDRSIPLKGVVAAVSGDTPDGWGASAPLNLAPNTVTVYVLCAA